MGTDPMNDFDAMWAGIVRSPLANAYLSETYWLAENVLRRAEEVLDSA